MQQIDQITSRPLQNEADFWRVRELLRATYPITPLGFNWEVRRWDGSRFHHATDDWKERFAGRVQLWETADSQLVGVVNPEGEGNAHLQVHPDFRAIEPEMIAWAEAHLATPNAAGKRQLEIFVFDYDGQRQQLLQDRGYTQLADGGVTRRLRLAACTPPPVVLATPYQLRTTEAADLANCQRIADLLNAAFNRNFHTAVEFQNFTRQAPCYRPDLDLVAVAPDGAFAAYVGIAYDDVNGHAAFEPVCTHPAHRRHGLAQTLMVEGLHRLKALGATDVIVDTGDMIPANRLYDSIGFTEVCRGHVWRKEF
ncbi:MAG: GNAT family N-acetyltransferase [Caldilineaceae bacterium]